MGERIILQKIAIRKLLNESLGTKFVYSEKYQDKYYLHKEIQDLLPDVPEAAIYKAIDEVNSMMKSPIRGKKFVDAFVEKLTL